jgi:6-phosphogluconolactonase
MGLEVHESIEDVQTVLADRIVRIIEKTAGEIRLALGGGRTPGPAYGRLRDILLTRDIDRSRIRVFVTDDNVLLGSNERMINSVLCQPLGISCVAPAAFDLQSSSEAKPLVPLFHAAVLGLGIDSHTAALFSTVDFSGDDRVLRTTSPEGEGRISLGMVVLAQAREIFLIAAGHDKSAAVETLFCGGESSGAAVARWSQTTCLVDGAAGSRVLAAGGRNEGVAL